MSHRNLSGALKPSFSPSDGTCSDMRDRIIDRNSLLFSVLGGFLCLITTGLGWEVREAECWWIPPIAPQSILVFPTFIFLFANFFPSVPDLSVIPILLFLHS